MIISCPNCGAQFNVKAELLGTAGRKVKCSKCAHRWLAMPDGAPADAAGEAEAASTASAEPQSAEGAETPPPPPPPPPSPQADPLAEEPEPTLERSPIDTPPPIPPESHFHPSKPQESRWTSALWILLLVVIGSIGFCGYFFRKDVVVMYPPATKFYAMIGLEPNVIGHGLKIEPPRTNQRFDGDVRVLEITGTIRNTSSRVIDMPTLLAKLHDKGGTLLKSWTFKTRERNILPGEEVSYRTEVRNPPRNATDLSITFTADRAASSPAPARTASSPKPTVR